jgi:N-succinyldiaminopimelate aminotransferase
MPRHPDLSPALAAIEASVFSSLLHRLAAHDGEIYPFHVGDTWLEPAEGCRMQDLRVDQHPGMHRYAPPRGIKPLLEALAARVASRSGVPTEPDNVLVTTGATGGLSAVAGAILEPGDEVLVLAPYWPLITGIVRCFHGNPVAVPLIGNAVSAQSAVDLVDERRTGRTVALYISTPNNPTGRILPPGWVTALVEWATRNDLRILSDDGMAGNRCGYVVGPRERMGPLGKVSIHAFYSTPTASQLAACRALDGRGDAWIDDVRERYREMGNRAADRLGVARPEGSTFLFPEVADCLDDRGLAGFLERCVERGLLVAPGTSFGSYPTHVRVCFTCASPDLVDRGIEVLARLLGR